MKRNTEKFGVRVLHEVRVIYRKIRYFKTRDKDVNIAGGDDHYNSRELVWVQIPNPAL
jgi:hypothetical protein